ncbi:MAG: hypothetical protein U0736_07465 [Gemmataceae bacterium]
MGADASQPPSRRSPSATLLLLNPSASNEVIGKAAYRRSLVTGCTARCVAAYVYASCGVWESTTDVVFGGHNLVAENGTLCSPRSRRFQRQPTLTIADIDLDRLRIDRLRMNSFSASVWPLYHKEYRPFREVPFRLGGEPPQLAGPAAKAVRRRPPVRPRGQEEVRERCEEIFSTQVAGLARRLE